jgi:hypothetical protein
VQERAVRALYLAALGRAGSQAELDQWVPLIGNNNFLPSSLVAAIENSTEGRDHLVKSWYIAYLGRQAQGGEEMGLVTLLENGQSEEEVLSMLLGSLEFFNRAQTLVGTGTPNERFVQALYELLLGRTGSPAEVSSQTATLTAGSGTAQGQAQRQAVAQGFLQGTEFRTDQFNGYYNALLHRPPGAAELNSWVFSNLDLSSVRLSIEADSEFFTNG